MRENHGKPAVIGCRLTMNRSKSVCLELIGKVQAFLNQVSAYLNAGILTQAEADAFVYWGNILLLGVTRR